MFTGIIEGRGDILSVEKLGKDLRLRLRPQFDWPRPAIGESVAVNGACLTMESWQSSGPSLAVYASAETLAHTTLGELRTGSSVNMERALALGDRLGGHLVSGHVDTVAEVVSIVPVGESRRVRLAFDTSWSRHIIPKGSVALDGISLTVNACGPGYLEVNVIPETWRHTTIAGWKPKCRVNMETDLIGKYVAHLLGARLEDGTVEQNGDPAQGLSFDFLRQNGF